jgi:hypothetical protein
VPELPALLAHAYLYVKDEVDVRHHPTLTPVWSKRGNTVSGESVRRGRSQKAVGFAALDYRDGWCSYGFAPGRTADVFVHQLNYLVERSQARGRRVMVLVDNAKIHTPTGAKVVREAVERNGEKLRLVYTPAYDPAANPTSLASFPPARDPQPSPRRRCRSRPRRLPLLR